MINMKYLFIIFLIVPLLSFSQVKKDYIIKTDSYTVAGMELTWTFSDTLIYTVDKDGNYASLKVHSAYSCYDDENTYAVCYETVLNYYKIFCTKPDNKPVAILSSCLERSLYYNVKSEEGE